MSDPAPSGPQPIPPLQALQAYKIPHASAPIDLWLHGNEGPAPSPELLRALSDVELMRRYPSAASLEGTLAHRLGVPAAHVLVTAGADDALDRVFRAYLAGGWGPREVILPSPTFVMLPHYAKVVGATPVVVPWPREVFPEQAVLAAITPDTRAIALVTPNNPTGAVIAPETITRIAAAAPNALILVDLAYGELADLDVAAAARACPNALVFRTFSKAWGLAGARVGYVEGAPSLLAPLRAVAPPFAVAAPSLALASARMQLGDVDMRAYVARVRIERLELQRTLAAIGTQPVASQANFVFTRLASPRQAVWLRDALGGLGIGIRAFPAEPELADSVRITCPGDVAQLERLLSAVRAAFDRKCWSFGLTADDMRAARKQGRVPIGLGDPTSEHAKELIAAGAARVVSSPAALAEVLP